MHALLVSTNDRIIAEFEKIVAVTQSKLEVSIFPTRDQIKNAYRVFIDPDVTDIQIEHPTIALVTGRPVGTDTWKQAMSFNATYVATIPESRDWLLDNLTAPITQKALCVAIVPGAGGAGASTIASALAFHATSIFESVCLIDCDQTNAGLDIILGIEGQPGMRWPNFRSLSGAISGTDILRGLPVRDDVSILSTNSEDIVIGIQEVLEIVRQILSTTDLVILDLSRDAGLSKDSELLALADMIWVVVPATVRGCASADRVVANATDNNENVELVVRSIPGATLTPLEVAQILNLPLAGYVSTDTRVVEQIEQGFGISSVHVGGFTRSMNLLANRLSSANDSQLVA
jgi:secretion/DNA translocation related CpaE-like protein